MVFHAVAGRQGDLPSLRGGACFVSVTRSKWKCMACHKQFLAKVGTIFEESPLGFDKWFPAMWLIVNAKNGINSHEIHRALGVTQKTAWFMLHRIRLAMQSGSIVKLKGDVEVGETYIGGRGRFMHASPKRKIGMAPATPSTKP
jgi:hypothetical protein